MDITHPHTLGKLYLNIIWHQHQPLYLDPEKDQLQGPWVRTHGTKDYYDMASILEQYPDVHCSINLTSSLLFQLENYYVSRLKPFVDIKSNCVDTIKFFSKWQGKTDPWIDLALKPTSYFNKHDIRYLLYDPWNALYITDVMIERFPEYKALKEKANRKENLTEQELREIKFWFFLAYFDPDFLENQIQLVDGSIIDLTDIISKNNDGKYFTKRIITEKDCNRIVTETYKILVNIIPLHKKILYNPKTFSGQIEIATTPYYHPILPLIYKNEVAKICRPNDPTPSSFSFPDDANAQVEKSVEFFKKLFGQNPSGMWPAEGSVSQDIIPIFSKNGIQWIATDEKILARSKPNNLPKYYPFRLSTPTQSENPVAIVFRDTELSDKIGFVYQHWKGKDAANDFINNILQHSPPANEPNRLVTVILDGENAWEWYRYDNDGKEFLHSLYKKLTSLFHQHQIITVTMSEYINGNPKRNISAHPISTMQEIEWLHPGSWINASFDTWIGKEEKNRAWEYLLIARKDLANSNLKKPDYKKIPSQPNTKEWYSYQAWEEMYAAEGSDWFWWYGTTLDVPGGIAPFDKAFITHLNNIYKFARLAGAEMPDRKYESLVSINNSSENIIQGTMAQSRKD